MLNYGPDMPISTKNEFSPNKGCQGHKAYTLFMRQKIPFLVPPSVSICLRFI